MNEIPLFILNSKLVLGLVSIQQAAISLSL